MLNYVFGSVQLLENLLWTVSGGSAVPKSEVLTVKLSCPLTNCWVEIMSSSFRKEAVKAPKR